jgi:hypothetical protein
MPPLLCTHAQWPSAFFLVGVALVMLSVAMYGQVLGAAPEWMGRAGKVRGHAALGTACAVARKCAPFPTSH